MKNITQDLCFKKSYSQLSTKDEKQAFLDGVKCALEYAQKVINRK